MKGNDGSGAAKLDDSNWETTEDIRVNEDRKRLKIKRS